MNKLKEKLFAHKLITVLVAVLAVGGVVSAYSGDIGTVVNFYEAKEETTPSQDNLGGVDFSVTPCASFNGIESCYFTEGFNEASTTLFSIKNPWGATSTVDLLLMEGHTGSKSADFYVGTSTVSSIAVHGDTTTVDGKDISTSLVNATEVATSSPFYIVNGQNSVNGTGQVAAGAQSQRRIVVGPTEYVTGYASSTWTTNAGGSAPGSPEADERSTSSNGAITGTGNKFYGNYGIRFVKHQTPQTQ